MTARTATPHRPGDPAGADPWSLLRELAGAGITLRLAEAGRLEVTAPQGGLSAELRDRIARCKPELVDWLAAAGRDPDRRPVATIVPDRVDADRPFPPSDLQTAYLVGSREGLEYFVRPHQYMEWDLPDLDPERLERAVNQALFRQRASIVVVRPDLTLCRVANPEPLVLTVDDLRARPEEEVREHLRRVRESMRRRELPLDRWPWLEMAVTRYGAGRARLHYNHNNFFVDGAATNALLASIWHHYHHPERPLPPIELSFRDCVLALAELANSAAGRAAERYWRDRMADWPDPPPLPLVPGADPRRRSAMTRRDLVLPAELWSAFTRRAAARGLTASAAVYGVFAEVISYWSGSRHFLLNNMITHRAPLHPEIGEVLGNLAALFPLEVDWRPREPFHDRVRRLGARIVTDVAQATCDGSTVLATLNQVRGTPGRAACPVVISSGLFMGRLDRPVFSRLETPQVLLDCQFWEQHDGSLWTAWDLIEEMFLPGVVDDMQRAYRRLLERLAADDAAWDVDAFDLLPEAQREQRRRLNHWPGPAEEGLLHERLGQCAAELGDKPAVVATDRTLGFAELHARVADLAARSAAAGVRPGDRMAVLLPKGWEQVVAVLAALTAGAAYLPLDPGWPDERLRALAAGAGVAAVLTDLDGAERLPGLVSLAVGDGRTVAGPAALAGRPDDIAYVIYTSGSTGRPKAAVLGHRGPLGTIRDVNRRFGIRGDDVIFGYSPLCFDLSVYDIFGAIEAGATLVVAGAEAREPGAWLAAARRHRVTVWNSVPAVMDLLAAEAVAAGVRLPHLRTVLLSGDRIPVSLPDRVRGVAPAARVISLGGATEASIWSIYFPVDRVDQDWTSVPYGRPLAHQSWHVLDGTGRDAPTWTPGDLYIGGHGLAREYLGDPDATVAAFVPHPRTGERLYRTGDRGRYLPSGDLEFLGRTDLQVKIHGYRVEPGEVEHVLRDHPDVAAAAVVATDGAAGRQLVGFVTPAPGGAPPEPARLRTFLAGRLPGHLVPGRLAVLAELPLTGNGKVDRRALAVAATAGPGTAAGTPGRATAAARNATEQALVALWEEFLGVSPVGVDDDFFALGGQSFAALRMLSALATRLGRRVPLGDVLELRTVAALARRLDSAGPGWSPLVRLRDGAGDPWFLVHPAGGNVFAYRELAAAVDRPCLAFQAPGPAVGRAAPQTVAELADEYLPILRDTQPRGPYTLGGWSSGGTIAFELAHRLETAGERVHRVVLFDAPAPAAPRRPDEPTLLLWFLEDLGLGFDAGRVPADAVRELAGLPADRRIERAVALAEAAGARSPGLATEDLAAALAVYSGVVRARDTYRAPRITADLTVLRAREGAVTEFAGHPGAHAADWGWAPYTRGRVLTGTVPGTHHSMFEARHTSVLAAAVVARLG